MIPSPHDRSDLHPKFTKADDPWEIDPERMRSINDPSSSSAPATTIREAFLEDDTPYHVVKPEDTLVGVSLKYNVSVRRILLSLSLSLF